MSPKRKLAGPVTPGKRQGPVQLEYERQAGPSDRSKAACAAVAACRRLGGNRRRRFSVAALPASPFVDHLPRAGPKKRARPASRQLPRPHGQSACASRPGHRRRLLLGRAWSSWPSTLWRRRRCLFVWQNRWAMEAVLPTSRALFHRLDGGAREFLIVPLNLPLPRRSLSLQGRFHVWGTSAQGASVLLRLTGFQPYFYVAAPKGQVGVCGWRWRQRQGQM